MIELDAQEVKSCCAAGYSSDLVSLLLGDSYHPGGHTLTRTLLSAVGLQPGEALVDIASGVGTSTLLAASEYGAQAVGVDLSEPNVAKANARVAELTLPPQANARFVSGDAEALPLPRASADVVICECALCTFPDKPTAAREMARVLRPGGRLGLTDIAADTSRLPAELTGITAWVACIADARPAQEYAGFLTEAGLAVDRCEAIPKVLETMIDRIEARLTLVRMTARAAAEELGVDFALAPTMVALARECVADGRLSYVLLTARKPR